MRHTVIGLFDNYAEAESARDTLVRTGFAHTDVELQANPEPAAGEPGVSSGASVLANIERFLSSLFASGSRADNAQRYTDAIRRGAVLVCVNAASESHAELASKTLTKLGAVDVGERAPGWEASLADPDAGREHSVLDELGIGGIGGIAAGMGAAPSVHQAGLTPGGDEPLPHAPSTDDAAASAIAAGAAPGSGAVLRPDLAETETGGQSRPAAMRNAVPPPVRTPDEFMEYEEDFRSHYDEQYASENARYEDYVPAYRYGATLARDARFRDRSWDEFEPEARLDWESSDANSWERFKVAVRHGWERVTGHHHV
ncbi:hypothetical protein [Paraburkholderia sp.]|uniref:hypothetical protein n=1 Tax=Paraburkholderia sp. TaxID=1926495 RepID=UPI003D6F4C17